jgi:hypothetical protein
MERSVKAKLTRSPILFCNVGVRSQSARAAWVARAELASASWLSVRASAAGVVAVNQCG